MSKKTKQPKPVKCGQVTYVSVSRLFNLGNYQNIKYDLSAGVGPGESAAETFRRLNMILQTLKPFSKPHALEQLKAIEGKEESELSEYQKANRKEWELEAADYALRKARFFEAVKALDDLGGASLFKDAKNSWETESDDPIF